MNIGILSGKGGTGKTTVSTNLALEMNAGYIDCDVEEPNGFVFLQPEKMTTTEVQTDYPVINYDLCTMCGKCAEACQFNALARTKKGIVLYEKMCHSCGACELVCEPKAITYGKRTTGVIDEGKFRNIQVKQGVLNVGEPIAVPIVKKLLENLFDGDNIIDFPPGTACTVVNALKFVDSAILVTEPTEFGLHDLKMAVRVTKNEGVPFGVIVNKNMENNRKIHDYCEHENIPILGEIPYSQEIARIYSRGSLLVDDGEIKNIFDEIIGKIKEAF